MVTLEQSKKIVIVLSAMLVILLGIFVFVPAVKSPTAPSPAGGTAPQPAVSSDGRLRVVSPLADESISSPTPILGTVTGGGWFFEASFPVKVLDGDGAVLGQGIARAGGEPGSWMSTGTVPFTATITFTAPKLATGMILFQNDNPSGDPARQKELAIPVRFAPVSVQAGKCKPTGCSGEICSDQNVIATRCEYTAAYACYKAARCERQANGVCGWTQTSELLSCLSKAK